MSAPISLLIGVGRIRAIHIMQHLVHVSIGGFNDKVIVIAHKHIAVKPIAELFLRLEKVLLKLVVIALPEKDPLPLIAPRSYVIKSSPVLYP